MITTSIGYLALGATVAAALLFGGSARAAELDLGAALPDVTVLDQDGREVSLAQAAGEGFALVYFYPKADTAGCTKQACSLRDAYATLGEKGMRVFGVSTCSPQAAIGWVPAASIRRSFSAAMAATPRRSEAIVPSASAQLENTGETISICECRSSGAIASPKRRRHARISERGTEVASARERGCARKNSSSSPKVQGKAGDSCVIVGSARGRRRGPTTLPARAAAHRRTNAESLRTGARASTRDQRSRRFRP